MQVLLLSTCYLFLIFSLFAIRVRDLRGLRNWKLLCVYVYARQSAGARAKPRASGFEAKNSSSHWEAWKINIRPTRSIQPQREMQRTPHLLATGVFIELLVCAGDSPLESVDRILSQHACLINQNYSINIGSAIGMIYKFKTNSTCV